MPDAGMPAYLRRSAMSSARSPLQIALVLCAQIASQPGIVDPRDIRTVTFLIVEDAHEAHVLVGLVEQKVDDLIAARRVLHEHETHLGAMHVENLRAPEAVLELSERL